MRHIWTDVRLKGRFLRLWLPAATPLRQRWKAHPRIMAAGAVRRVRRLLPQILFVGRRHLLWRLHLWRYLWRARKVDYDQKRQVGHFRSEECNFCSGLCKKEMRSSIRHCARSAMRWNGELARTPPRPNKLTHSKFRRWSDTQERSQASIVHNKW